MDNEKVGKLNCPACGIAVQPGDVDSTHEESIVQCSRCAMIAELMTELIRKHMRGPRFDRAMAVAGAR
jgi:hypothetical protein